MLYYKKIFNTSIKEYLYFTNILETIEKKDTKHDEEEEAKDQEEEEDSKNMSYFNSLCKANNNNIKLRNVMGRLHYSNFI